MDLEKIVPPILLIVVLCDGFNGEFSTPTAFDIIKWIACAMMLICCIVTQKSKSEG